MQTERQVAVNIQPKPTDFGFESARKSTTVYTDYRHLLGLLLLGREANTYFIGPFVPQARRCAVRVNGQGCMSQRIS